MEPKTQKPSGGFIQALIKALRAKGRDPEAAREAAEEINEALPTDISGREAVLRKRKQYRDIEDIYEDSNQ